MRWNVANVGLLMIAAWMATGEALSWWFSRSRLGTPCGDEARASEALVVLGSPSNPDGTPSLSQRYRCEIAVRSRNPQASRSVLVFTGRTRGSTGASEAEVMARHACDGLGVDPFDVRIEEEARNTWENIANTIPMVEGFDVVKIISNPFHARRGRGYLQRQSPALGARLRRSGDHRFGEWTPVKPVIFWYLR